MAARGDPEGGLAVLAGIKPAELSGEARILMAELLSGLGRREEALAALEVDARGICRARGDILLEMKKYSEAAEAFGKELELDQRSLPAWYGRGMALLGLGKAEEALACFDTAIGIDGNYVWAWAGKAKALEAKGDSKPAARARAVIKEIDPGFSI